MWLGKTILNLLKNLYDMRFPIMHLDVDNHVEMIVVLFTMSLYKEFMVIFGQLDTFLQLSFLGRKLT